MRYDIQAVERAQAGDKSLLRARLLDPAVTLTMTERLYLADEYFTPAERPTLDNYWLLDAYTWLTEVEKVQLGLARKELFTLSMGSEPTDDYKDQSVIQKLRGRIDAERKRQPGGAYVPSDNFNSCVDRWNTGERTGDYRPNAFYALWLRGELRKAGNNEKDLILAGWK